MTDCCRRLQPLAGVANTDTLQPRENTIEAATRMAPAREYKSKEVAQSQIYVIVHSLHEVSFCTQPFPNPSAGLW